MPSKDSDQTAGMRRLICIFTEGTGLKAWFLTFWLIYDSHCSFQAEVKSLRNENQLLRSGDKGLSDIKERTTYVAEQLLSATKTAESSLK